MSSVPERVSDLPLNSRLKHSDRKPAPPRQKHSRVNKSQIQVIRVPAWSELPWLVHGFSTRTGGNTTVYRPNQRSGELNLGFTASDPKETVLANRRMFVAAVTKSETTPLVTLKQIHSSIVQVVGKADAGVHAKQKADAMMTNRPGILLGIQTADCIPILIADTKKRAVAAFHAGWRGTLKRIVESGVGRMRLEFGSRPENLVAAIGPGIGACCYAVGEEVQTEFESQFIYASELFSEAYDSNPVKEKYPLLFLTARAPGHSSIGPALHLDLVEANRRQLLDAGLSPGNIFIQGDCTSCRTDRYFSHRADHGFTGRSLSVIGIRK
jgi:polyphenol oxidase